MARLKSLPSTFISSSKAQFYLAFVIVAVLVIAYLPVLTNSAFVWDDRVNLLENVRIQKFSFAHLRELWAAPLLGLYIPVTYSIWSSIWACINAVTADPFPFPLHAQAFHIFNLLLHVINTLLVFGVIARLIGDKKCAIFGALLFGIHPVQVESVAYVTELRTQLAFLFSFLSVLSHLRGDRKIISLVLFALALLSKPASVILPLVLLALDGCFLNRELKKSLSGLLPWFALSVCGALITITSQPLSANYQPTAYWLRPAIALDTLGFYLGKLFVPEGLGVDYGRTPEFVLSQSFYFSALAGLAAILAALFIRKKRPMYFGCFLLFVIGILPVSGLLEFYFQLYSTVADRYLYFAMFGPALAASIVMQDRDKKWVLAPVVLIGLLLMFLTFAQARTWNSSYALFDQALDVNPRSYWARNNLANSVRENDLTGAILLYHEAIIIKPDYDRALENLAVALLKVRDFYPDFDLKGLEVSRRNGPENKEALFKKGVDAIAEKDLRTAVRYFGMALGDDFADPACYNNLGVISAVKGALKKAEYYFRAAMALANSPVHASANNYAVVLYNTGKKEEALSLLERIVKPSPDLVKTRAELCKAIRDSSYQPQLKYIVSGK